MNRQQLDTIIDDFYNYDGIDIKAIMAIESEDIIDIILKCNSDRKKIIIDLYNKRGDDSKSDPDIDRYRRIAYAKSPSLSKFLARVYAVNPMIFDLAEHCEDPKTREVLLKVLENVELYEIAGESYIAYMGSKIINEKNEEKQEVLADFLCDEDIQKLYDGSQILGLFDQLNTMEDIEKCKKFIEHTKTLKNTDNWTSYIIIKNMPEEIIEETIDTSKIEDLKKLARLLYKADIVSFSSKQGEIDGKNAYIKVKFQSSKNDN